MKRLKIKDKYLKMALNPGMLQLSIIQNFVLFNFAFMIPGPIRARLARKWLASHRKSRFFQHFCLVSSRSGLKWAGTKFLNKTCIGGLFMHYNFAFMTPGPIRARLAKKWLASHRKSHFPQHFLLVSCRSAFCLLKKFPGANYSSRSALNCRVQTWRQHCEQVLG